MLRRGACCHETNAAIPEALVPFFTLFKPRHLSQTPVTFRRWHGHYKAQYQDGLRGPFIVTDPTAPTYAADQLVTLTDWYHDVSSVLLPGYMSPASGMGVMTWGRCVLLLGRWIRMIVFE